MAVPTPSRMALTAQGRKLPARAVPARARAWSSMPPVIRGLRPSRSVWGLGQLFTGPLSDRLGRKPLITGGMLLQALALAGTALAGSFLPWAVSAILLGVGTAMVYPTLLAAIGDVAHASWRATAVGVY